MKWENGVAGVSEGMAGAYLLQDSDNTMWGVSLVICSHNGASRLLAVLAHVALQRVPLGLPWEVVLVDNASTDDTAAVARANWPVKDAPAPLRVVYEGELGLTQARCRGLREARYEIVCFIDDDNWLAPDWLQIVVEVMGRHAEVGACGGMLDAAFELSPPQWFDHVQKYYAVGPQHDCAGDITWSRGYLWGAGLTVRKTAWKELAAAGFRFELHDRAGHALTSGGDAELCLALRLAGWKLWYEPAMKMKHYIPASRMEWQYLERVARGFGAAAVVLNAYATVRQGESGRIILRLRSNWLCQAFVTILRLLRACGRCLLQRPRWEGNEAVLDMIYRREVLAKFLRVRRGYDALCRRVQHMSSIERVRGIAASLEVR